MVKPNDEQMDKIVQFIKGVYGPSNQRLAEFALKDFGLEDPGMGGYIPQALRGEIADYDTLFHIAARLCIWLKHWMPHGIYDPKCEELKDTISAIDDFEKLE